MKIIKIIVYSITLIVIAATLLCNIFFTYEKRIKALTLKSISLWSTAQAENGTPETKCNGSACDYVNGNYYVTSTNTTTGDRICCGLASETNRGCKTSS
jgi:hypothetical protein